MAAGDSYTRSYSPFSRRCAKNNLFRRETPTTDEPATFEEGDWNNDGVFNQLDIIAALQTGNYLQGPYASLAKSARDADVDAVFDGVGLQQLIRPI